MMRKLHNVYVITAILIISVFFSGCMGGTSEAQADFEKIMNTFKTADRNEIDKVYSFSEVLSFIEESNSDMFSDAIVSTLSKMDYRVISTNRVSSTAVNITVKITTVDYSEIVKCYVDKIVKLTESKDYKAMIPTIDESEYEKLMTKQMIDAIEEYGDGTTEKTVDVTMTKSGDKWRISGDSEEFLGALFANLSSAVESLM